MSSAPYLSVCIPTYNRPAKLRQLVEALLAQLTSECELVILDNCSEPDAGEGLQDLLVDFKVCPVRVIRNAANVGGNANILRCFEMAQGEWVWVTGDDDLPENHAVASLLAESRSNSEAVFINFASNILDLRGPLREKTVRAEGLAGLIEAVDNFSNLLFVSAGIYRRKVLIGHLRQAYAYIDTCGPHLALVFLSLLNNGGITLLSHRRTIHCEISHEGGKWDPHVVHKKLQHLLDLISSVELRETWFRKVKLSCPPPQRTFLSLFKYLVSQKGNLESIRDQLELASYLASMVPSYRWRAGGIWLTAYMTSILWPPFYLAWSMIPNDHAASLANYGKESDFMRRFLDDNRV